MKRIEKIVAVTIIIALFISVCTMLITHKSMAAQSNVTVVITADSDSKLKLEDDNQTLTYTCGNGNSYGFTLKQGDNNITFVKHTDEVSTESGTRFFDSYVAEGISSNEDVRIAVPVMNFNDVQVVYDNQSIGMWEVNGENYWASQYLVNFEDANNYQFRIEENINQSGGNNGERPASLCDSIDFGTASWTIGEETVTASVEGKTLTEGPVSLMSDERITLTGYNQLTMEPVLVVIADGYEARLNTDGNQTWVDNTARSIPYEEPMRFIVRERTGLDEQPDERPAPNTTATVNLSSDAQWADSYKHAMVEINGYPINTDIDYGEELPAVNEAHYFYDDQANTGRVTFSFSTLFIDKFVGTIEINGEVFDVAQEILDYSDRTAWLNHYGHQTVTLDVEVDKADVYNVKINTTQLEGAYQWIGNFLWTSDERESGTDAYIGHSTLEVVNVTYEIDGVEHFVEGSGLLNDRFIEYDPYNEVKSLALPEGSKCTLRIVPDFGYQVLTFGANGSPVETGEEISTFIFPIHKGNFHLGAQVVPVENMVDAKSSKVQSGSIEIGNNQFDTGSLVLTVNDVELDEGKQAKFQEEAGDYTISNYLDIDLDKVLYKGTEEDVWAEGIHELNGDVTISLKLEEEINGDETVLIHNINDGEEYEVIKVDSYDPETKTISFKTKSFSSYAIASKDQVVEPVVEPKPEEPKTAGSGTSSPAPKTGDNIIMIISIFTISIIGIVVMVKKINKSNGKH